MLAKKILIVAAHAKEIGSLKEKSLEPNVVLKVCGNGRAAKKYLSSLIQNEANPPSLILNIGFVGALWQELDLGEIILSNEFLKLENSTCNRLKIDQPPIESITDSLKTLSRHYQQGVILTVDEPITDFSKRDQLLKATGALVVDMESYYLASGVVEQAFSFGKASIPFLSLKVVSDQADEESEKIVKLKGAELAQKLADYTVDLLKVL